MSKYAVIWEPPINKGEVVAVFDTAEDAWLVATKCILPHAKPRVVRVNDASDLLAWAKRKRDEAEGTES
jgi:hypothetical protein